MKLKWKKPLPKEWYENWEAKDDYLKRDGTVKRASYVSGEETPGLKGSFEWCIQRYRREDADEITDGEKTAFLELIDWMLSYRPQGRPTVKEVLSSKWMVKYALPDYERSLGFDLPFILSHIH